MLDADRPITKSNQDRLNRSLFAKYLARNMLDRTDPESLVIGIHGGWGVGKTSILNLVLEEIHLASSNMLETEQPIILNFNPWPYSGQKHLTLAFFRELTACIAHQVKLSDPNSLITLLNQYIDFFVPHTPQYDLKSLFTKKELVDPQELKGRLNHTWAQEQRKLIIVIDNITQLQPAEIKEIFQLVKTIADFTNTIFLLAYDEKRIANGKEYIAKVVQLSFAVPKIAPQDLENILFARLRDTLAYVPESAWNKEYWADIYYSSLKYLFTNCRDITRYVNTLNFGYLRIKDLVDPVD